MKIMRKLTYDCYYRNIKMKNVETLKEAEEWKAEDRKNTVKERLVDYKVVETEKEREKRLERVEKRQKAIKTKVEQRINAVTA